ncbi:MAG: helix-turn-helix transcriptional regulator [Bacteroidaceae bacterium]|nr:helix-turn-helix transcriptional regulator [Bacteroidaceae bacterium]
MLRDQLIDPLFPECPIRNVLSRIGDKWTLLVLLVLDGAQTPLRFKELQRAIPDISEKMLTLTLRNLEADGLVGRTAFAEVPPRVEYNLTERSGSLMPLLNNLVNWSLENFSAIITDRRQYAEGKKN